jgi:WD40 repeat protein
VCACGTSFRCVVLALPRASAAPMCTCARYTDPFTGVMAAQSTLVSELQGHSGAVASLAYHPTEPLVLSAAIDGTVRLWGSSNDADS